MMAGKSIKILSSTIAGNAVTLASYPLMVHLYGLNNLGLFGAIVSLATILSGLFSLRLDYFALTCADDKISKSVFMVSCLPAVAALCLSLIFF